MALHTLKQRAQQRQAARPRKPEGWRLWLVVSLFTIFGVYNASKVFSVQVLDYSKLSELAEGRIKWKDTLQPRRGVIYDARGQLLAGNTTADDIYVDKTHLKTDEALHRVTDLLAPALGQPAGDMFIRVKEAPGANIKVASRIDKTVSQRVRELVKNNTKILKVVSFESQPLRQYPAGSLAASVLGFADHENAGHYGVEEYYNAQLAGEAGWILAEHDAAGRPLALQQPEMQPAKDGYDITLTIDSAVQYLAERELKASIEEFRAESGYVVVQDPETGAILAMANYPTFDPNAFSKVTDYSLFKNPVVNDVREPGSTMKILTYASAIDAGAVMSSTTFYGKANLTRFGWTMWNATGTEWGWQSMTMGLGRSDNVASMYAAEKLGESSFYDYTERFGIGKRTGIDLTGEVAGIIHFPGSDYYSPINLYTNSFGQGVATTPIQLVNSVSSVANGGKLLKPYIVKEIKQGDKVIEKRQPEVIRHVIKEQTGVDIADMLSYGVENKLVARFSRVPGYHVSVKTGTAQNVSANGGYEADGSFASAMGWGPSHNPRFTLYVGLLNPRSSQWGENTASVSWGRLAKEILLYMKVQPSEPLPTPTP